MYVCEELVDLPPAYGDTSKFRSTLGHKTNHKFVDTNVRFSHTDTARFGLIASMTTTRDVEAGEELFLHYGYPISLGAPRWYLKQYQELIREKPELEGTVARVIAEKDGKGEEEAMAAMGQQQQKEEVREEEG